ncbi:MAG: MOSC domain-containing protein [Usitatibacter sp.]
MAVTLSALHIYPVKGLKGISLTEARCTDRGLEHDRRWMVVDSEGVFLSQREHPKMATVWTDIGDGALSLSAPDISTVDVPLDPRSSPSMRVRVWNSVCDASPVSPYADAWLSDYLGLPCRLVYMPEDSLRLSNAKFAGEGKLVGFADAFAYLIAGEASLCDLNARLAARGHPALPMNRFRPNLVVSGAAPYEEDGWKEIRVGEAVLRSVKPCGRCQVTTTDQSTGEVRGPEPLATLSTYRDSKEFGAMFGMNLVTVKGGMVKVGDRIETARAQR